MADEIRRLVPGDEAAIEQFLGKHGDSCMFLRSNLARGGLVDTGEIYHGTYVGRIEDGIVTGVTGHAWNGMILVQASPGAEPDWVARSAREVVRLSGRPVSGFSGPLDQVRTVRRALDMDAQPATYDAAEVLFALDLAALRLPAELAAPGTQCRRSRPDEFVFLTEWMTAYRRALFGSAATSELRQSSGAYVQGLQQLGHHWLLEVDGVPVAMASFNATTPERVQIGGVWTPMEWRGRGYARAVVAGALLDGRAEGATRGVLFTNIANLPAQRAYYALGFEVIGDYGIVLFA